MFEVSIELALFLIVAAFAAGFIDSIAGGGGLITVPALLIAGLTPVEALGTNKIQSVFGSGSAVLSYSRAGLVDLQTQYGIAVLSFIGAVLGALLATVLPTEILRTFLPILLIAIALYFAFRKGVGDADRDRRLTPFLFGILIVPAIGFYDGVFGPGAGSFFMLAFVALAGFGILKATAHTKLLNFASNAGGLVGFAIFGAIAWKVGIAMGIAQFIGARLGSGLAMKNGANLIKPLLVIVCLLLALRLLTDSEYPLWQLL